jgi:hypothetical protein
MKVLAAMLTLALVVSTAGCGSGDDAGSIRTLADTPENRAAEARRYLEAMPPRKLLEEMADGMAGAMPGMDADELKDLFFKYMDYDAFEAHLVTSLEKHFTATEIGALADFYGSDIGQSAMRKFPAYMADAMPFIQEQTMLALERAEADGR